MRRIKIFICIADSYCRIYECKIEYWKIWQLLGGYTTPKIGFQEAHSQTRRADLMIEQHAWIIFPGESVEIGERVAGWLKLRHFLLG